MGERLISTSLFLMSYVKKVHSISIWTSISILTKQSGFDHVFFHPSSTKGYSKQKTPSGTFCKFVFDNLLVISNILKIYNKVCYNINLYMSPQLSNNNALRWERNESERKTSLIIISSNSNFEYKCPNLLVWTKAITPETLETSHFPFIT